MLSNPEDVLVVHVPGSGFHCYMLYHFFGEWGEADWPVVPWILLSALLEDRSDIYFSWSLWLIKDYWEWSHNISASSLSTHVFLRFSLGAAWSDPLPPRQYLPCSIFTPWVSQWSDSLVKTEAEKAFHTSASSMCCWTLSDRHSFFFFHLSTYRSLSSCLWHPWPDSILFETPMCYWVYIC